MVGCGGRLVVVAGGAVVTVGAGAVLVVVDDVLVVVGGKVVDVVEVIEVVVVDGGVLVVLGGRVVVVSTAGVEHAASTAARATSFFTGSLWPIPGCSGHGRRMKRTTPGGRLGCVLGSTGVTVIWVP